jgi:2-polyprenyl-3-methyl-5-hydroxy-6-metoxy-1,4-benzoquinol methylase
MSSLFLLFDPRWWSFQWRYLRGRTPWDTNITPPEVNAFLEKAPSGHALDIGCGTGTNAVAMAKRGWRVTGIDFAASAIHRARRKASDEKLAIDFRWGDVADLGALEGPFDYALDIGCLHSLDVVKRVPYADGLKQVLRPGGIYMLYAWLPRIWHGRPRGISGETVRALLGPALYERECVIGEENGAPSAWYWFVRR